MNEILRFMQKHDEWTDARTYGRRFIISRPSAAGGRLKNDTVGLTPAHDKTGDSLRAYFDSFNQYFLCFRLIYSSDLGNICLSFAPIFMFEI